MAGLWLLFLAFSIAWGDPDNWHEVLDRVRENVLKQVKKSTNYTCVQTVDRTSFTNARNLLDGCAYDSQSPEKKRYMHDRLRLDIAVSEGREIFAWHGTGKFSGSSGITDVVRRGTISSGEFVGFLENIFGHPGVRFEYAGAFVINGASVYSFNYTVPLGSSGYRMSSARAEAIIPYHGSFSVRASDSQLISLTAIGDAMPEDLDVCSTETQMQYQLVKISGEDALIPSLFVVKMVNAQHFYSVTENQYSQCHAFKTESSVRFDVDDTAKSATVIHLPREERLPARTILRIGLESAIDNETSYTGDPVQGILLHALKMKESSIAIPKGAAVSGVITMLEERDEPKHHFLVSIEFDRITFGDKTVVFRAAPVVSPGPAGKLREIYGSPLPHAIRERYKEGLFVFASRELHLDRRFSSDWITEQAETAQNASAPSAAR